MTKTLGSQDGVLTVKAGRLRVRWAAIGAAIAVYVNLRLASTPLGGFVADFYWSSSEFDASQAWYQNFITGFQGLNNKLSSNYVRPVRAF